MMPPRSTRPAAPLARRKSCLDMLSDLSAYLDGELSDARCRAIEEHLDKCPCCDQLAAGLRRAVAVCRNGGLVRLPPAVRRRARMRIAALLASQRNEA